MNDNLKTWPERVYLLSNGKHLDLVTDYKDTYWIEHSFEKFYKRDVEYIRADVAMNIALARLGGIVQADAQTNAVAAHGVLSIRKRGLK